MNKVEICRAFREAMSEEFINIPSEDKIIYEFSDGFKTRMEKLFGRVEKNKTYTSSRKGKNAIIIIAAILITFALMMSVSAVREPIVDFIYEIHEGFMEIFFEGDKSVAIEHEYTLSKTPDGFTESKRKRTDGVFRVEYINKNTNEQIILHQSITDGSSTSLDTEQGTVSDLLVNDIPIVLYEDNEGNVLTGFWTQDVYSFILIYYGEIDKEDFIEIIKSIR